MRIAVQAEHQSRLQQFYSRNLSSGGIYVEVEGSLPAIGTKMKLTFEVPKLGRSIQAEAEVLHHHQFQDLDKDLNSTPKHGMGLRFVNLSKSDEALIHKYISGKDLHVRS